MMNEKTVIENPIKKRSVDERRVQQKARVYIVVEDIYRWQSKFFRPILIAPISRVDPWRKSRIASHNSKRIRGNEGKWRGAIASDQDISIKLKNSCVLIKQTMHEHFLPI